MPPSINSQFVAGALAGATLSSLLVLSFAWQRVQETSAFADQNMRLFFAAIDDVESMREFCGIPCQDQELTYPALMERYGYKVERSGEQQQ